MTEVALLPMTAARSKARARGVRAEKPGPGWKLGDYITAEMRARGITDQGELGALIGVNQSSVSRWITGESRGPSGENAKRLAEFLHMPVQDLLAIKYRAPGPITATALEREVRSLQGEVRDLNAKLDRMEALVDVLIRATGASPAAVARARRS